MKALACVITRPLFSAPWDVMKMKQPSAAAGSSRVKSSRMLATVAAWLPSPEALRTMIFARGTPEVSSFPAMVSTALSKAGSALSPAIKSAFQLLGCGTGPADMVGGRGETQAARSKQSAAARIPRRPLP